MYQQAGCGAVAGSQRLPECGTFPISLRELLAPGHFLLMSAVAIVVTVSKMS